VGSKFFSEGDEQVLSAPDPENNLMDHDNDTIPNWITCLASVPNSFYFVSGSGDGHVKIWKISETIKSFSLHASIPIAGFCNDLSFDKHGDLMLFAVAIGKEMRMGRWWSLKQAKNCILLYELGKSIAP
jgi:ribosomal RNA-processing protein 9